MAARTLSLLIALWLFSSAYAFPRTPASFANDCSVGLAAAAFAVLAMTRGRARLVDAALAAWLLAAAALLPHASRATAWNEAAVGSLLLGLSLVPGTLAPRLPRRLEA